MRMVAMGRSKLRTVTVMRGRIMGVWHDRDGSRTAVCSTFGRNVTCLSGCILLNLDDDIAGINRPL
jgi:hypothetical protein